MNELSGDSFLEAVPDVGGYKTLEPCVLYARLGQGGMGAVYRGRHLNLDIEVAVKCLKRALAADNPEFVSRFQREAKVAAQINDSHLIRVYDVCEAHGLHYLVMEYVDGENVRERVERKGRLAPEEAAAICLGAARGLAAAHASGVVHRDMKPDNVLISRQGEVKVADLGLARAASVMDSVATATNMMMGTPHYMPPEQFEGAAKVGPPGDVYALGATLYFMLTGENAIPGETLTEIMRHVCLEEFPDIRTRREGLPEPLLAILERATKSDPNDRYADAGALAAALDEHLASIQEVSLADDESGRTSPGRTLVSPPPMETISRIKTAMQQEAAAPTAPAAPASEDETLVRGSGATVGAQGTAPPAAPPRPSRRWIALVLVLALVALAGWAGSRLASRPETSEPEKETSRPAEPEDDAGRRQDETHRGTGEGTRPRATLEDRLDGAERLLARAATLDDAIAAFEAVLASDPGERRARRRLALALRRRAALHRDAGRLGDAWTDAQRAVEMAGGPLARDLVSSISGALREQLGRAVTVRRPRDGEVVSSDALVVEGDVAGSAAERVLVNGKPATLAAGAFDARVGGLAEGRQELVVAAEDARGLRAEKRISVVVDTRPPKLAADWPKGQPEPGPTSLTGTVSDTTACTVEVNGKPAEVTAGRWTAPLMLAPGPNETVVTARDAAGHDATPLRRTIRVRSSASAAAAQPVKPSRSPFRLRLSAGDQVRYRLVSRETSSDDPTDPIVEGMEFTMTVRRVGKDGSVETRCKIDRVVNNDADELAAARRLVGRAFRLDLDARGRATRLSGLAAQLNAYTDADTTDAEEAFDFQYVFAGLPAKDAKAGDSWERTLRHTTDGDEVTIIYQETCTLATVQPSELRLSVAGRLTLEPSPLLRQALAMRGGRMRLTHDRGRGSYEIDTKDGLPKRFRADLDVGFTIDGLSSYRTQIHVELTRLSDGGR